MINKTALTQIFEAQYENIIARETGLPREALLTLPDLTSHALIVTGVRRCGKSTLLFQLLRDKYKENALYVNFEDTRLYGFEVNDFARLDEIIKDRDTQVLLFDELQIIKHWERYTRQKLDEGYKVIVTGSNSSLLSGELGTKLTGRHITRELFPFSYREFCTFSALSSSKNALVKYMEKGGFPEYVRTGNDDILNHLFDDILVRDIAVRYGIRDVRSLKRLALYLVSNVGKPITGNRLKKMFEIGTGTVLEYLSHLELSWMFHFLPKFSYSLRKQLINPRKVYGIDTGMIHVNSGSFSEDHGRIFENLVFLFLRRRHREIYYFSEKGECDFLVFHKGKVQEVIQVCYHLNKDNQTREIDGLMEALAFFNLQQGTIVTLDQQDSFEKDGRVARVVDWRYWLSDRSGK